ncbi:MAG: hypothetical protein ACK4X2_10240 [Bacteroidota bacterium]
MVFLFRDRSVVNILLVLLLSVGVHLHAPEQVLPTAIPLQQNGLFSYVLAQYIYNLPLAIQVIIFHALLVTQALRLNMVMQDLRMFSSVNYVPAMTYVLLSGLLMESNTITETLVSNSLTLWIFIKLSRLYNNPEPKALLFNIGIIAGISILLFHPTAILIVVVLFALAVVRPFRISEWLVLLLGVLLPYYFLLVFLYLNNQFALVGAYLPNISFGSPLHGLDKLYLINLGFTLFATLVGLYQLQSHVGRLVIQIRKNWGVMMVLLFTLILSPFMFSSLGTQVLLMGLVPLSATISNGYSNPKKLLLPNFLFWTALGLIIINNWHLVKI